MGHAEATDSMLPRADVRDQLVHMGITAEEIASLRDLRARQDPVRR